MPFEFLEWEEELAPQASSSGRGAPPRNSTRIGVLDPPGPPKRPAGPIAAFPASFLTRLLAWLILGGLALFFASLLFAR
jgi:hypothetical protein